jgi:hypothetical protein
VVRVGTLFGIMPLVRNLAGDIAIDRCPGATSEHVKSAHSLTDSECKCLSDASLPANPDSPEVAARALIRKLWPRLRTVLTTHEHVYCFVRNLSTLYGESIRELRPEGVLVVRPAPEVLVPAPVIDLQAVEVAGEYGEVI